MTFTVNTSPSRSGRDLRNLAKLRERLAKELLTTFFCGGRNGARRIHSKCSGRGRTAASITNRRMMAARGVMNSWWASLRSSTKRIDGKLIGPGEHLTVDVPEGFVGVVMEQLDVAQRAKVVNMHNHVTGECRIEFRVPSPRTGLACAASTHRHARTIVMNSLFRRIYRMARGNPAPGSPGALIATVPGLSTAYALWGLQGARELFVGPGVELYEGMIIGENAKDDDLDVNAVREKKAHQLAGSTADEAIRLVPFRQLNLEQAIEFHLRTMNSWEITPKSLRLRKKFLQSNSRKKTGLRGRWKKREISWVRENPERRPVTNVSGPCSCGTTFAVGEHYDGKEPPGAGI